MVEIVLASTMAAIMPLVTVSMEREGCVPAFDVVVTEFTEKEKICEGHWKEYGDMPCAVDRDGICNYSPRIPSPSCQRPKGRKRTFSAFICPDGQMRWKVKP